MRLVFLNVGMVKKNAHIGDCLLSIDMKRLKHVRTAMMFMDGHMEITDNYVF